MTISSSLSAGVAGLNANATKLATISDNIANSGTFGYKTASADFESLVIGGISGAGTYSAGGVRATTQRLIDENGPLISTSNPLDIAISGRGMLPV
ncbi:MAG: flagellar hook basal-body protein, partial [Maritimibacter sp.]|nr:flagellar hook basal-body protein [Maritimibacter sp.]